MSTYKVIDFEGKVLFARGRNGSMKQKGMELLVSGGNILICAMSSRGTSNSCAMQFPLDNRKIDELIETLQKMKQQ